MQSTKSSYRNKIVVGYCTIFYVLMLYKWLNGMFMYQMQPAFFYTREDIFTWVFMTTGLHKWLLNNEGGWVLFDILFYTAPLLFYIVYNRFNAFVKPVVIAMLLINWVYVQCYTLYPTNSIEAHIAWLLFPIVFIPRNENTFALLFDGLRYFFLFFFASSGIWKFVQGGIFNFQQMSNILIVQHKELLISTPQHWYARFIYWLVEHPALSYFLYAFATLLELAFIVGFFTKKYDRLLLGCFILFLVFDHFVMRIPYYEVLPLMLTLIFSKSRKEPSY
jgi:hypothetical protein